MQKMIAVEEAKALMNEALDWSLWGWLTEKRRLRVTADKAWEALDEAEKKVRAGWSGDLRKAWHGHEAKDVDPEIKLAAKKLKEVDAEAYALRMQAEETFDEADRRMSTGMAREGARQAIDAWETREKFLRKMEALGRKYTL